MNPQARFGRRLGREIAFVIGLKLVALFALWFAFFSPAHRPVINPAAQIYGAVSTMHR
jgi:hypothetical protein